MKTIDLNCDLGESFGSYKIGNDELILNEVTSANIACGFHAGDAHVMYNTVLLAKERGVAIGAHPGFHDIAGFGRREIPHTPQEITEMVLYQIGALSAFCKAHGVHLSHVKPHGALYNLAAKDPSIAAAIAKAVFLFDSKLALFGLSGSELIRAGKEAGLQTVSEVFADRTYQKDGSLTPRKYEYALLSDTDLALAQVIQMIETNTVTTVDGVAIPIVAESVCVHGDNEHAYHFAKTLRENLTIKGVTVCSIR
jgi:5-oxoprolinase (ATP-hydrolysing) subunit A